MHGASVQAVCPIVEPLDVETRQRRGEALLRAINDLDRTLINALLTKGVRYTLFDRGELHEAKGRAEVTEALDRLSEKVRLTPGGSRVADDAVFFWGGARNEPRPGWMVTLFFEHDRFADVRVYLLR